MLQCLLVRLFDKNNKIYGKDRHNKEYHKKDNLTTTKTINICVNTLTGYWSPLKRTFLLSDVIFVNPTKYNKKKKLTEYNDAEQ